MSLLWFKTISSVVIKSANGVADNCVTILGEISVVLIFSASQNAFFVYSDIGTILGIHQHTF